MKNLLLGAVLALAPVAASAASIITDGEVSLGVNDYGHLNVRGGVADVYGTTAVGVRWIDGSDQYEATSHGCLCEGWGIGVNNAVSGYASIDNGGVFGLDLVSFASTATTATSVTELSGLSGLTITHDFALSASANLFKVTVTIANTTGAAVTDIVYRRAMDWDTSPTPFNEYVTIAGTGTTSLLQDSSDNGFTSVDPLGTPDLADLYACGADTDFDACGPADHGAAFDFALGDLADGESYSFDIFFGGAANRDEALAALGIVGAELYSFGWSGLDPNQDGIGDSNGEVTPTFIFAFKGVGGSVIVPPPSAIPLPAGAWLMLGGIGALAALRRARRRA